MSFCQQYSMSPAAASGGGSAAAASAGTSTFAPAADNDEVDLAAQIRQEIELLKSKVAETGSVLDKCRQEQEAFSMEYYTYKENNAKFESMKQQVFFFLTIFFKNRLFL